MIDLRLIREHPEAVKAAIATTYTDAPIDEIVAADERRRALLSDVETLKAELNQGSKQVGRTKDPDERQALIASMRDLGDRIAALDEQAKGTEQRVKIGSAIRLAFALLVVVLGLTAFRAM